VLYHQEEQSYEQIAATLKMPIGTVRTHLHRGRKRLRDSMQAESARPATSKASHPQPKRSPPCPTTL
jgi:RNA polymerase sigma-70 factor (ECF subfamily)